MTLKIDSVVKKPFKGSDGDMIDYYWTTATRTDGVSIQFGGGIDYTDHVGESLELPVIKTEALVRNRVKIVYKDTTPLA